MGLWVRSGDTSSTAGPFDPDWIGGDMWYRSAIAPLVKKDREHILFLPRFLTKMGQN